MVYALLQSPCILSRCSINLSIYKILVQLQRVESINILSTKHIQQDRIAKPQRQVSKLGLACSVADPGC